MYIVWHHLDLRIHDNPALVEAAAAGQVLPLYIYCPEDEGRWSIGSASKWWLHHSLESLSHDYKQLGTRLVIRKGKAIDVFQELIKELKVEGVYWNLRYEPQLLKRDRKVKNLLDKEGVPVRCFEGNYLITPSELLNKTEKPYSVYTPFSKAVIASKSWRSPLRSPKIERSHRVHSEPIKSLNLLPKPNWAKEFDWSPGRQGAVRALKSFKGTNYAKQRDFPAIAGTSRLSPHLHFGEISPHEVWKAKEKNMPFLKQLLWREFGNYFLYHFPAATDLSWREQFEYFPWEKNRKALRAWQQGMTGYPIVDAGMRQLWHTGWMHNRVRMVVASFLVKDLFIHWIEGAKWFWDTLVDADLANNTLGWQWVAGSGPDAAPYFRIFNPILQSEKFDPEGAYIRQWVPELAHLPFSQIHFPPEVEGYPLPIVEHSIARQRALGIYREFGPSRKLH